MQDQNFDLGLDMLSATSTRQEVELKQRLEEGKRRRDRRKGLVRVLALTVVLAVLGGIAFNYQLGKIAIQERQAANVAKAEAEEKAKIANAAAARADNLQVEIDQKQDEIETKQGELNALEASKQEAESALQLAENAKRQAEQDKQQADSDKEAAIQLKEQAELAKTEAVQAQQQAEIARQAADEKLVNANQKVRQAELEISSLEEGSRLLRYKSTISAIAQKTSLGDYRGARELLDQVDPNDQAYLDWQRLNLLAHPEITGNSRFPAEVVLDAVFSNDRSRIAICFQDRVEICASDDLNRRIQSFDINGPTTLALSTKGEQLAMGSNGQIEIFAVASKQRLAVLPGAQSNAITDLEFSHDDQRLLSVGQPDLRKRSQFRQHELMVWVKDNRDWKQLENPHFFGRPAKPLQATFSRNGRRIVTSNPSARPAEQVAYVLELTQQQGGLDYYKWLKPKSQLRTGFLTSQFADDAGLTVISSVVERSSGGQNNQLALWEVAESSQTKQAGTDQFISTSNQPGSSALPTVSPRSNDFCWHAHQST